MRVPEFSGLGQTYPIPISYSPITYPRRHSYGPTTYPLTFGGLGGKPRQFIKVPEAAEKALGDNAEEAVVKEEGGRLGNKRAAAYVNAIGQKLVKNSRRPNYGYKFDIVKNKSPNAFALPNGSVYITTGLLGMLKNEAQLANVLGHEVSHVTESHTVNQIEVGFGAATLLAIVSALLDNKAKEEDLKVANDMVFGLVTNGYSRENETESDKYGQRLAAASGWDPSGMVDVMQVFLSLEKQKPEGIEAYMRSHPYSGDRVEEAKKRLPGLPKGKLGEAEYNDFLTKILNVPVRSAIDFMNQEQAAAASGDEIPMMPLLFLGGAAVIFALVLLKK